MGCDADETICGVYSTLEKAMSAFPVNPNPEGEVLRPGGWQHISDESQNWWWNGLSFDESASITRYEVDPQ